MHYRSVEMHHDALYWDSKYVDLGAFLNFRLSNFIRSRRRSDRSQRIIDRSRRIKMQKKKKKKKSTYYILWV